MEETTEFLQNVEQELMQLRFSCANGQKCELENSFLKEKLMEADSQCKKFYIESKISFLFILILSLSYFLNLPSIFIFVVYAYVIWIGLLKDQNLNEFAFLRRFFRNFHLIESLKKHFKIFLLLFLLYIGYLFNFDFNIDS